VLLTTQYMEEADQLADEIVVIDRGLVAATGTPDQLKAKVGGQVLVVSPVDEADLGTVACVVGELSGDDPEVAQGAVSVAVSDAGLPPAILQRLTAAGVRVAELSLRKPSLDEVFFALTGHRAGPSDDDRSAA
jgi:oleandomycin transport system ATP-binding protein